MDLKEFYLKLREDFADITASADSEFVQRYDELDHEMKHLWFESLANSINSDMNKNVSPEKYIDLFEFVRKAFLFEDEDVKQCIDVSFVENLFWQVPRAKAKNYWQVFPDILKELYVNFHQSHPA